MSTNSFRFSALAVAVVVATTACGGIPAPAADQPSPFTVTSTTVARTTVSTTSTTAAPSRTAAAITTTIPLVRTATLRFLGSYFSFGAGACFGPTSAEYAEVVSGGDLIKFIDAAAGTIFDIGEVSLCGNIPDGDGGSTRAWSVTFDIPDGVEFVEFELAGELMMVKSSELLDGMWHNRIGLMSDDFFVGEWPDS